jgi:hypothetical protein
VSSEEWDAAERTGDIHKYLAEVIRFHLHGYVIFMYSTRGRELVEKGDLSEADMLAFIRRTMLTDHA